MTDLFVDELLERTREPEPRDEAFVSSVMTLVRLEAAPRSSIVHTFRRPVVVGLAAAVLATGGAVAALVGDRPSHEAAPRTPAGKAAVSVSVGPPPSSPAEATQAPSSGIVAETPASTGAPPLRTGLASAHTSYAVDLRSGLKLVTETYTTRFYTGIPQRVTLTLENTSESPVAVWATQGCALEVLAFEVRDGTRPSSTYPPQTTSQCAGASGTLGSTEQFVLAPGATRSAEALVTLPNSGTWGIGGACRCRYQVAAGSEPTTTHRPLDGLSLALGFGGPTPAPASGKPLDLVTPPLWIRAS